MESKYEIIYKSHLIKIMNSSSLTGAPNRVTCEAIILEEMLQVIYFIKEFYPAIGRLPIFIKKTTQFLSKKTFNKTVFKQKISINASTIWSQKENEYETCSGTAVLIY